MLSGPPILSINEIVVRCPLKVFAAEKLSRYKGEESLQHARSSLMPDIADTWLPLLTILGRSMGFCLQGNTWCTCDTQRLGGKSFILKYFKITTQRGGWWHRFDLSLKFDAIKPKLMLLN